MERPEREREGEREIVHDKRMTSKLSNGIIVLGFAFDLQKRSPLSRKSNCID